MNPGHIEQVESVIEHQTGGTQIYRETYEVHIDSGDFEDNWDPDELRAIIASRTGETPPEEPVEWRTRVQHGSYVIAITFESEMGLHPPMGPKQDLGRASFNKPDFGNMTVEPPDVNGAIDTGALKESIEQVGKALSHSFPQPGDHIDNALKKLDKVQNQLEVAVLEKGDAVLVESTAGSVLDGTIVGFPGETAQEETIGNVTVEEYWEEHGYDIPPDDPLVDIEIPNADQEYSFPACKVHYDLEQVSGISTEIKKRLEDKGIDKKTLLVGAEQEDLAEVEGIGNALAARIKADIGSPGDYHVDIHGPDESADESPEIEVCPHCESEFAIDSDAAVEGDQGELLCSLDCLHEEYR